MVTWGFMRLAVRQTCCFQAADRMQHHHANKKLFRVGDHALVVYRGRCIIGVKHHEVSPWLAWNIEHVRWDKALPVEAKDFEQLPLTGHVDN